jgi:hypothetical protein
MGRAAQKSVGARLTHLALYCVAAGSMSLIALASALPFISAKNKLAADSRMLVTFLWTKKDQPTGINTLIFYLNQKFYLKRYRRKRLSVLAVF